MKEIWPQNTLTRLLHLDFPIVQSPMAGCCTPELVTSICYAGGLGSFGASYMSPHEIKKAIGNIRLKTRKRFNVNLYCFSSNQDQERTLQSQIALNTYRKKLGIEEKKSIPVLDFSFEDQLEVIIEERVPVFSFSQGLITKEQLEKLKANGTIVIGCATNVAEVKALDNLKVDAIVVQGSEAGGQRSTFIGSFDEGLIGLMCLIPQARAVTKLPLIAAGGIMCAQQILSALLLGADGVQIGTAFLASTESALSNSFKNKLLKKRYNPTIFTDVYTGRPTRALSTDFLQELQKMPIAEYPYQRYLIEDLRKKCVELARSDFVPLYVGQGLPMITDRPAIEIFYDLAQSTSLLIKQLK